MKIMSVRFSKTELPKQPAKETSVKIDHELNSTQNVKMAGDDRKSGGGAGG